MKKNLILFFLSAVLLLIPTGCSMLPTGEEAPLPLSGTVWRPVKLADCDLLPAPGADVRLVFQVGSRVGGSAGDNRFFGPYRLVSGGGMKIGPLSVTWRNGPNRGYEERFLAALRRTAFYSIRGNTLTLLDEQRRETASFRGYAAFPVEPGEGR